MQEQRRKELTSLRRSGGDDVEQGEESKHFTDSSNRRRHAAGITDRSRTEGIDMGTGMQEPDWSDIEDTDQPQELRVDSPTPSEQAQEDYERRIYVLGVGAVGTFIAHSLRGLANPPPITLLLHSGRNAYNFESKGRALTVTTSGRTERLTGFDHEQISDRRIDDPKAIERERAALEDTDSPPANLIRNLIVTTKTLHTFKALQSIAHRLTRSSTITFLQNGMGVIDQLNSHLFTNPSTRPTYLIGIVSHGLYQKGAFSVEHRGHGTIALSVQAPSLTTDLSSSSYALWPVSARYMMRTLTRTSILCALGIHPTDLLLLQLEKLAANCVINPLTTIYNCANGDLGVNPGFRAQMRLIIAEISLVFRNLPELKPLGKARIERQFSAKRIEFLVQKIMKTTAPNMSSMWQDVFGERADGRMTEIDYLNGYIVRRGEEMGIKCIVNYMLTQQVEAQRVLQQRKRAGLKPFETYGELDPFAKEMVAVGEEVKRDKT